LFQKVLDAGSDQVDRDGRIGLEISLETFADDGFVFDEAEVDVFHVHKVKGRWESRKLHLHVEG